MQREEMLQGVLGEDGKPEYLDSVVKMVLGDMGEFFHKFWQQLGPGVMVLQPGAEDKGMFWLTLAQLNQAKEDSDSKEFADHLETIILAAQKIDPDEKAGYMIWDHRGTRYFEVDYNKVIDS